MFCNCCLGANDSDTPIFNVKETDPCDSCDSSQLSCSFSKQDKKLHRLETEFKFKLPWD